MRVRPLLSRVVWVVGLFSVSKLLVGGTKAADSHSEKAFVWVPRPPPQDSPLTLAETQVAQHQFSEVTLAPSAPSAGIQNTGFLGSVFGSPTPGLSPPDEARLI